MHGNKPCMFTEATKQVPYKISRKKNEQKRCAKLPGEKNGGLKLLIEKYG